MSWFCDSISLIVCVGTTAEALRLISCKDYYRQLVMNTFPCLTAQSTLRGWSEKQKPFSYGLPLSTQNIATSE
ncbi:hypothetical protein XELAEV_18019814mg [Xenopus laevis]|uniref:Uncharacterized protein n=1 Tax=Xenopus laevis TaxID=8355 RepID=A0A974D881_XENLA|nr:hypothetical protein XELAEV_18019814mg [Xenopus laevis]